MEVQLFPSSVHTLPLPCPKPLPLLIFFQRDRPSAENQEREKSQVCIYQNVSNNNIK